MELQSCRLLIVFHPASLKKLYFSHVWGCFIVQESTLAGLDDIILCHEPFCAPSFSHSAGYGAYGQHHLRTETLDDPGVRDDPGGPRGPLESIKRNPSTITPPPHTPGEDEHLPHPPVLRLDLEWLSVGDAGFWLAHPPVSWNNSRTCGTGTKPPAAFARNPAAFAIEPWLSKVFVRRLYWKSLNAG